MIKPSCLQQYHKIPVIVPPVISPPGYKPIKSETDFSFRLQAPAPPPDISSYISVIIFFILFVTRWDVCMHVTFI